MVEDFKNTDVGMIPSDWEVKTFGEFGTISGRVGWKGYTKKDLRPMGPYAIGAKHIDKSNRLDLSDPTHLTNEKYLESPEIMVFKDDILIVQRGSIGKVVLIDKEIGEATINPSMVILRLKKNSPSFVFYYLVSSEGQKQIVFDTSSTGVPMITQKQVTNFKIPLPPTLAEQSAIATALNDVDALINQLEQLISKKIAIRNEISRDLLSGDKRIGNSSEKWNEVNIEKLCKTFTKQTGFDYSAHIKPKLVTNYVEGVIPFIQNKDFNGYSINFNTDYFIPLNVAKDFPRILLDEKCLLISISGSIGNVGVFNNHQVAFLGGAIAVAKFHDVSLIDWVMYYLKSPNGQNMMVAKVKTGSHQNLILDDIRKMLIPIPDKIEMQKIVTILSDMDNEIQDLGRKLEKYKMLKQGMMQNLLTGKIRLV